MMPVIKEPVQPGYFCSMKMKPTILVIDDCIALRENTAELLEMAGYNTLTAGNGGTGFDLAQKYHPDIIICDMVMPITNGMGFLKLIKKEKSTSQIPLIFFSADSASSYTERQLEKRASAYLRKPFTEKELLDAVKNCLEKNKATA